MLKVQQLRLAHFTEKQVLVEVGYGSNLPKSPCDVRVRCFPSECFAFTAKPNAGAYFEIFRHKSDALPSEDEYLLFELTQNERVQSVAQLPVSFLMDQKVKELQLEF